MEYAYEMAEEPDLSELELSKHRIAALECMITSRGGDVAALKVRIAAGATLQTPSPIQDTQVSQTKVS